MDNNNNAILLNITYGKYPKLCEKNMTRNVNNNTVGNTHQSAIEMQVKKWKLRKVIFQKKILNVVNNIDIEFLISYRTSSKCEKIHTKLVLLP